MGTTHAGGVQPFRLLAELSLLIANIGDGGGGVPFTFTNIAFIPLGDSNHSYG